MTWDVLLLRVRPGVESAEDLTEETVVSLGTPAEVRAVILRACPQAQFGDATTGRWQAAGYSAEVSLGEDDPVRGVLLLISGDASQALGTIGTLCAANGWHAFDMNTEEFLELA